MIMSGVCKFNKTLAGANIRTISCRRWLDLHQQRDKSRTKMSSSHQQTFVVKLSLHFGYCFCLIQKQQNYNLIFKISQKCLPKIFFFLNLQANGSNPVFVF